ncbi:MAG: VWA domain-containing protein, partial [Acidimicrobiales bacterium]
MSFLEPDRLYLLLGLLVLVALYVVVQRRRKVYAARLASAEMLSSIIPRQPGWRRHIAALVLLSAIGTLTVGFAKPTAERRVPRERATVVVAIDVSLSMEADDVDPTRLDAAKQSAEQFVSELPPTLNVGIVAFAGQSAILVAPTQNRT